MFGASNIEKNSEKEKWIYGGYVVIFDSAGSLKFNKDFVRNVITFNVDKNSSSYDDNHKNNFFVLGDGPTYGINGIFGLAEKRFAIKF